MLLDSEFWNTHVLLSNDILFDGVKVVNERPPRGWARYLNPKNDWFWNNTDGINPDSSHNITIRHSFFHTGDDCTAVKNTGTFRNELCDVRNIHIHDNVMIGVTPMKIGTETRGGLIEDVTWENNEVVFCGRPIAAEMKDGAVARNIVWRNIRVRECNRPFDLEVMRRQDDPEQARFSRIENVILENVAIDNYGMEGKWHISNIRGLDRDHGIRGVLLKNIHLGPRPLTRLPHPEIRLNGFAEDIRVEP
jgi:polygalacturonase